MATPSADAAAAHSTQDTPNPDSAQPHQPGPLLESDGAESLPTEARPPSPGEEGEHTITADRVALVPWGSGSAPSLPSIDDGAASDPDRDSIVGSNKSSTQSVNSSIYHFVEEHGRTYHKYKEGKYLLPNDEEEQERLDLQHACFIITTGGKLHLAPIGNDIRHVLDLATGTGIWAIEFAQMFPEAQIIGTDLSPIQPEYVPTNCTFEIDDAEEDWTWGTKFDYIHGRALVSCFSKPVHVINQAFDALAPGAYLEYQDGWFPMGYVGDPPVHSNLYKWNELLMEATAKMGRDWGCTPKYPRWFKEAGFEDIVERRFYWPLGQWVKGKYYKQIAAYAQEDLVQVIETVSLKMFKALGWTVEQTREFAELVRQDLRDPTIHAYCPVMFIWGRKPSGPAASAAPADPPVPDATS